jgi:hypothetical protein
MLQMQRQLVNDEMRAEARRESGKKEEGRSGVYSHITFTASPGDRQI